MGLGSCPAGAARGIKRAPRMMGMGGRGRDWEGASECQTPCFEKGCFSPAGVAFQPGTIHVLGQRIAHRGRLSLARNLNDIEIG